MKVLHVVQYLKFYSQKNVQKYTLSKNFLVKCESVACRAILEILLPEKCADTHLLLFSNTRLFTELQESNVLWNSVIGGFAANYNK